MFSKFFRKFSLVGYLLTIFCLFLYSFTQIDLSLTLSRLSLWQIIQKSFQQVGYFNRPLSALYFILILFFLFLFYFLILIFLKKIEKKLILTLIFVIAVILTFSYNAFSYDLFNYIFDAKIVTYYHQNPYYQKALDYPKDPMLSFMHWTHRVYPYGPSWLAITVPLSFLGGQYFLPTLYLFKLLSAVSFVGTAVFIGKIVKKISPENEKFAITFFALNPLVIIEGLVSAHNDMIMIFFMVWSVYLFIYNKYFHSSILFVISVLVKYATLFVLPAYIIAIALRLRKKQVDWNHFFLISTFSMAIAIVFASLRTNFQPWYLLFIIPFAAPISRRFYIFVPIVVFSIFSLSQYIPFLYLGNWNPPIPTILSSLLLAAGTVSGIIIIGRSAFLALKRK